MLIEEIINKYRKQGHSSRNANNLAAEEIILTKIASSELCENITLKGGIVMFNLSKNDRRVTQDIDFDFISYSINQDSIKLFINKLNNTLEDISVNIIGKIEKLHHENYHGVRVHLSLLDKANSKLHIKMDIGVHTYSNIIQNRLSFSFSEADNKLVFSVNPPEQIFVEKLLSFGRLGVETSRYKDLYDLYYLISNNFINTNRVKEILNMFFNKSIRDPKNIDALVNMVIHALNEIDFDNKFIDQQTKWLDVDYILLKQTIINYVKKLM